MTPARWRLVKAIVQAAVARPAAARPAFVVEACGDDTALRAEVSSLLTGPDTGEDSDGFLASPLIAGAIAAAAASDFATGEGALRSTGTAGAAHEAVPTAARSAALSAALAGRYDLERELGRGGMASVYLARDLRHGRRVALKVLHPELAAVLGNERFLAEIRTTATLQHPNILPLFDSGTVDGVVYYVMPHVAGESLRDRLDREGQLAVDAAVKIATDVADALECAHRQGVVHRDIKPGNILLKDGHAFVADFGIALAATNAAGSRFTQAGFSLGTPHYMSPEQASADRTPDGRSDIYSLGAMCYEMLAGEPPFSAPTTHALLGKLFREDPRPLSSLRKAVPPAVEAAVHRALEKLPADRWGSAAEFAAALAQTDSRAIARPVRRRTAGYSTAAIVAGALAAFTSGVFAGRAVWPSETRRTATVASVRHWAVPLPESARFSPTTDESAARRLGVSSAARRLGISISPDAAHIAYAGVHGSTTALYLIDPATGTSTVLDGTERARLPAFSPDGRWLAFVADGELRKVAVDGGAVVRLAQLEAPIGLFWLSNEELLVSRSAIGPGRVSSTGGRVEPLGEHFRAVSFVHTQLLPDGQELLGTTAFGDLATISLATGELRLITTGDATGADRGGFGRALRGNHPRYLSTGYLVYVSGSSLMAVPFDPKRGRATGKPTPVVTAIRSEGGPDEAQFALSDDGTLVYAPGIDGSLGRLIWSNQRGTLGDTLLLPRSHLLWFRLSRDGRKLAIVERQPNSTAETRIVDLTRRGFAERVRVDGEFGVTSWSADARRLLGYHISDAAPGRACCFVGAQLDARSLALRESTAGELYRLTVEWDESPDGAFRCAQAVRGGAGSEIDGLLLRRVDNAVPPRVLGKGYAGDCAFSPDGRWVAFTSRDGLFVTRTILDSTASLVKLVPGASAAVRWTPDGRHILYHDGRQLFAVDVDTRGASVEGAEPRFLFQHDGLATTWDVWGTGWDVAPDGRLLLWQPPAQAPSRQLNVITNFPALVAARVNAGLTTR
jgi:serine/threonine-protein kinase